jgi:hypothetical protein
LRTPLPLPSLSNPRKKSRRIRKPFAGSFELKIFLDKYFLTVFNGHHGGKTGIVLTTPLSG